MKLPLKNHLHVKSPKDRPNLGDSMLYGDSQLFFWVRDIHHGGLLIQILLLAILKLWVLSQLTSLICSLYKTKQFTDCIKDRQPKY